MRRTQRIVPSTAAATVGIREAIVPVLLVVVVPCVTVLRVGGLHTLFFSTTPAAAGRRPFSFLARRAAAQTRGAGKGDAQQADENNKK